VRINGASVLRERPESDISEEGPFIRPFINQEQNKSSDSEDVSNFHEPFVSEKPPFKKSIVEAVFLFYLSPKFKSLVEVCCFVSFEEGNS
jgi:hypothetical protein